MAGSPADDTRAGDAGAEERGWREMVAGASAQFRERLGRARFPRLDERDRERLARRFQEAVDSALEVTPELPERIAAGVAELRARHPDADPVALAWARTRERARRSAAVGAVSTLPAMVPGIGPALAALGMVADWRYVAEQQRDLVLEVAAILGVPLAEPTQQVRTLFVASMATAFGAVRVGEAAVDAAARQVVRRSLSRVVPGVGAVVAGSLNYVGTLALGRAAIFRFAAEAEIPVRGVFPTSVHPALPRLRLAGVAAVRTAAIGDGGTPVFTREQREIMAGLRPAAREELLDLAVVSAAAEEGMSEDEERVVAEVAACLGFSPGELAAARREAEEEMGAYAARLRRLLGAARRGGAEATGRVWRRARAVARRGLRDPGAPGEAE
ncbi:MAG: TerB family tellurite resistance protein [Gemmatimonadota bacterium]